MKATQEQKKPRRPSKKALDKRAQEEKQIKLCIASMKEEPLPMFRDDWQPINIDTRLPIETPFWLRSPKGEVYACIANKYPDPEKAGEEIIGYCIVVGCIHFAHGVKRWGLDDLEDIVIEDGSHWYPFPPMI